MSSSVSKIAKEAGVSPATIYVYYQNKEDLLVSTYIDIKQKLSSVMLKDFNEEQPIRDTMKTFWLNAFKYIRLNPDYFKFMEQFSNSPYSGLINKQEVEKYFEPMFKVLQKGIAQKIIKDVHFEMLGAFIFYPLMTLANPRLCESIDINDETINQAFTLAWDAIKL